MSKFDSITRKLAQKTQATAEKNAVQTSDFFCRLWMGVEKVPKALLEQKMQ